MSDTVPAAFAAAKPVSTPASPKTPRQGLWRIDVAASVCPQLLPRLLGIVAVHDAIPTTIDYQHEPDGIRLAITVDVPDRRIAALMAVAMRRVITVETVDLRDHRGRPIADEPAFA